MIYINYCICSDRKKGVYEDNFGLQECNDCGMLLRKQPMYANFEGLKYRLANRYFVGLKIRNMKEIWHNILFILYSFASMMILGWAILFPFGIGMKDFPIWTGWFTYPMALIIMASQRKVLQYFTQKNVL